MQVLGVPPPPRTVARHRATWADHFRLLAAVRVDAEVGPPRALGDDPACMRRGVRQVLGLVTLHVSETYVHIHPTAAWAGDGGARRARVAHGRPGDVRARGRRARAAVLLQAAGRGGGRGARCRWACCQHRPLLPLALLLSCPHGNASHGLLRSCSTCLMVKHHWQRDKAGCTTCP